jgi:enoyl-CoA hydratase
VPTLRVDREEQLTVVTLDRPPVNVMDAASLHELADVFEAFAADEGVRTVVLTGAGQAFSAGLDLKALQHLDHDEQEELIEALNRAFCAVYACPRRVIAAVNGHAIAGGLILALCCDVRLVADVPLRLSLAEVNVGVVFPVGAIEVARHELTPAVARRLVLGGETLDAAGGVALGVLDRAVPADGLLDAARAAAASGPPPIGFERIKAQLRRPALAIIRRALDGNDPLPRPWLTDETLAASAAALRR